MPASAASSVGPSVSMPLFSQIAKISASENLCSLRSASARTLLHIANMDTDKNGGPNFLQAWRKFRRMTLQELADRVGTTAAVIHHLEQGDRGLSAKWLRKLAPALDTTPGHLLDHDPNDLPADVIDIFNAISDREKPRALRVLESFRTGTDD